MAAKPTYDRDWYTPANIKNFIAADPKNIKAVRKEYTRLRDIEEKRIKRIAEVPDFRRMQVYKKNAGKYPKLSEIKGDRLPYLLSALERFVSAKGSTVFGIRDIRRKQISTLHEHKYTFVTEENLTQFGEFMEEYRAQKLDELYDSGDAADTYGLIVKHHLDPLDVEQEFEWWLENHKDAKGLRPSTGKYAGSAKRLRSRIERKQTTRKRR